MTGFNRACCGLAVLLASACTGVDIELRAGDVTYTPRTITVGEQELKPVASSETAALGEALFDSSCKQSGVTLQAEATSVDHTCGSGPSGTGDVEYFHAKVTLSEQTCHGTTVKKLDFEKGETAGTPEGTGTLFLTGRPLLCSSLNDTWARVVKVTCTEKSNSSVLLFVHCTDDANTACTPDCSGNKGCDDDDGCGGKCGFCTGNNTCTNNTCVCTPNCASSNACGDDGCGGSCGQCSAPWTCDGAQCQCDWNTQDCI